MPGCLCWPVCLLSFVYVCYPVFCLSDNFLFACHLFFLSDICLSISICLYACLPVIYLSFVCLSPVCHLLSICQHVPVFRSLWVPVWLTVTCDILFSSFDVPPLFTLNQPLVFSSSLIVQPPSRLHYASSMCLLAAPTTPHVSTVSPLEQSTLELCSHPRIFETLLGLCWAASTMLLPGVCGIFPSSPASEGISWAHFTIPVFFSIDLLRLCGPEAHFIYNKTIRFKGVTHYECDGNTQLFYHPRHHSRSCLGPQVSVYISAQQLGERWGHFVLNRHRGGFLWMYDIVHRWGSPSRFTSRIDEVTHTVCLW